MPVEHAEPRIHWGWWLAARRGAEPKSGWIPAVTEQTIRSWERCREPPALNRGSLEAIATKLGISTTDVLTMYQSEPAPPPRPNAKGPRAKIASAATSDRAEAADAIRRLMEQHGQVIRAADAKAYSQLRGAASRLARSAGAVERRRRATREAS